MARLATIPFGLNTTGSGVEMSGLNNTVAISSTVKRSGRYAMRMNGFVSGSANALRYQFAGNNDGPYYFRFYIRVDTRPSAANRIIDFMPGDLSAAYGYVTLNADGTVSLYDDDGVLIGTSAVMALGSWYRLEILWDRSPSAGSEVMKARLDGTEFATVSTLTIGSGLAVVRMGANLNNEAQTAGDWYFADVAINDSTGSYQNSYPGSGKTKILHVNAAGDANTFATQTGGTADAANNYTRVSEVTPDDATTFNGSNTLDEEDMFNVEDSDIDPDDTINVVAVGIRFRNDTADATTAIKAQIKKIASGTILQSSAIVPNSTTWKSNATAAPIKPPITTYQDPDSINWTRQTLDTMQVGYKISTGSVNRIDVSKVWAIIDYTPARDAKSINGISI